jgi:hypothetical protein
MTHLPRARRYAEGATLADAAQSWPGAKFDSAEFYANSTIPVLWTGADRLDLPRPDIGQTAELYNLDAVAYESVLVGLFSIWRGNPPQYPGREKINEICVGFSRDGFHWDRPSHEPIVGVSEDPNAWNYSNVQSVGGCLLVVGDQLYIYASGRQSRDTRVRKGFASSGLGTLRRDGFVSMDAGTEGGELTTRPVQFSGKHLFVNVDAAGGELRAEILDTSGNLIPPFSRQNCKAISSNSTTARVSWNGQPDLSSLAGRSVKFRFYLATGSLYSFWVSSDQSGASHGYVGAGGPGFTNPIDTVGTPVGNQ